MDNLAQLALFERSAPLPPPAEIDFHAVSIPARTFTGDFYFAHQYASRFWFSVGDVAGKGIGAAVIMAMIQEELEQRIDSCAAAACDPSVTTARLDAFLKPVLPSNRFASAVIGTIERDGTLVVTNAGHCPPLIARRNGAVESIASTGPVLGMLHGARWTSARSRVPAGGTFLAYSDGLIEAQNETGEEFGVERLRAAFSRIVRGGVREAREIVRQIEQAVRTFAPAYDDDLTIIVARRS